MTQKKHYKILELAQEVFNNRDGLKRFLSIFLTK